VRRNYDAERSQQLASVDRLDWQTYTLGPEEVDFVLEDGAVRVGSLRHSRRRLLAHLQSLIADGGPHRAIVEFGCGDGRNLAYLKRAFPSCRAVGFELSPASVELARICARKFGADVHFEAADVSKPLPTLGALGDVTLAYSVHALEQMPRIYMGALANMLSCGAATVALFEPAIELYPWSARGLAARLRALAIDRVRGLAPSVRRLAAEHGYELVACRALGFADNPLNETCELILQRRR
jgi:SAM-dependent methyltransferase